MKHERTRRQVDAREDPSPAIHRRFRRQIDRTPAQAWHRIVLADLSFSHAPAARARTSSSKRTTAATMTVASKVQGFLAASRFAVVGASKDRTKFGNKVLRCYLQHGRATTPVNPREASIEGLPCSASLAEALAASGGEPAQLAVSIITPPKVTVGVLEEAAKLGIPHLWLQPGCDDATVVAKAKELGIYDTLIYGGPCVLVQLGYNDAYIPPSSATSS